MVIVRLLFLVPVYVFGAQQHQITKHSLTGPRVEQQSKRLKVEDAENNNDNNNNNFVQQPAAPVVYNPQATRNLVSAVLANNIQTVKECLALKADPNALWIPEEDYLPPLPVLHKAILLGEVEIVKALAEASSVRINEIAIDRNNDLQFYGREIAEGDDFVHDAPLTLAIRIFSEGHDPHCYEKMVKILLDAHADVETQDEYRSPLMRACRAGATRIVEMLLEKKAQVNKLSGYGDACALSQAVKAPSLPCMRLLLEKGANPNMHIEDQNQRMIENGNVKYEKISLLEKALSYMERSQRDTGLCMLIRNGADYRKLPDYQKKEIQPLVDKVSDWAKERLKAEQQALDAHLPRALNTIVQQYTFISPEERDKEEAHVRTMNMYEAMSDENDHTIILSNNNSSN
jgi:ankyrin repeat protein